MRDKIRITRTVSHDRATTSDYPVPGLSTGVRFGTQGCGPGSGRSRHQIDFISGFGLTLLSADQTYAGWIERPMLHGVDQVVELVLHFHGVVHSCSDSRDDDLTESLAQTVDDNLEGSV